jgi:kumamolisin
MVPDARVAPIAGSHRVVVADESVGAADLDEHATVTAYVRRPGPPPPPGRRTRAQFAATYGADRADLDAVVAYAVRSGLRAHELHTARRSIALSGTLGALASAFGTSLTRHRHPDGTTYRARQGELLVPSSLASVLTGVFGLDERPQARAFFRARADATIQYSPPAVALAYDFPPGATGAGECVALIELGGGFRTADLGEYFASLHGSSPDVAAVSVDGASNAPSTADSADGEVMLDIEVVASIAPGAAIAVYFAPNTDQGFLDAVSTAVHDATRRPSVLSISWGGAESTWTAQAMDEMEQALVDAAAMGVTVVVAAGDGGSTDGQSDGLQHVDFPASAPHALGCGGTRLVLLDGAISAETVWNDGPSGGATGGGISDHFAVPAYQASAGIPPSANPGGHVGRGVPDVSGDADPDTGYTIRVDGSTMPIGGTSAVAPLWAGLVARLNELLGHPVGFLHPFLYTPAGAPGLRDIVRGTNGAYAAHIGWDPCTGLGSPNGAALLAALKIEAAGA